MSKLPSFSNGNINVPDLGITGKLKAIIEQEGMEEALNQIEEYQKRINQLESEKIDLEFDNSGLRRALTDTEDRLDSARNKIDELYERIQELNGGDAFRQLKRELEQFRDIAEQASREVKSFLHSTKLDDEYLSKTGWFTEDLIEEVRRGERTASEAIVEIKHKFRDMLSDVGGVSQGMLDIDGEMFSGMYTEINSVKESLRSVHQMLREIREEGVSVSGVIGDVQPTMAGGGVGGLASAVDVIKSLTESSKYMTEDTRALYSSISDILTLINLLSHVDSGKLTKLSVALGSLSEITQNKFSTKSYDNLIKVVSGLAVISNHSKGIEFNISGLNDLKISKASLRNLADYLPQIDKVDVGVLKELSSVDFSNFQQLEIRKTGLDNVSKAVKEINKLDARKAKSAGGKGGGIGGLIGLGDDDDDGDEGKVSDADYYERAKKAIRDYYAALVELETKQHDLKKVDGKYVSESGEWDEFAKKINRVTDEYREYNSNVANGLIGEKHQIELMQLNAEAFNRYSESVERAANTEKLKLDSKAEAQRFNKSKEAITNYYKALTALNTKDTDIESTPFGYVSKSGEWSKLAAQINEAVSAFNTYEMWVQQGIISSEHVKELTSQKTAEELKYASALEATSNKQRSKADAKAETQRFNKSKEAITNYYKALTALNTKETDIESTPFGYVSPSGEWSKLATQINEAVSAYKTYEMWVQQGIISSEHIKELTSQRTAEEIKYAAALEATANKEKSRANAKIELDNYEKAQKAIKEYYATMAKLDKTNGDVILKDGSYISQSGEWTELASKMNAASAAYDEYEANVANGNINEEHAAELLRLKTAETIKYKESVEAAANAEKKRKAERQDRDDEITRYETAKRVVNEYYATLAKLNRKDAYGKVVQGDDGVWVSKTKDFVNLAAELNRTGEAFQRLKANMDSLDPGHQAAIMGLIDIRQSNYNTALEFTEQKMERAAHAGTQLRSVIETSGTALKKGEKALRDWAKAESSNNSESREAYKALQEKTKALKAAREAYDGTRESALKLKDAEKEFRKAYNDADRILAANDDKGQTFGKKIKGLVSKFTSWLSVADVVMEAVQAVRQMVTNTIELDTAMTELKKVTDESDTTYAKFLDNAAARSKKLGATLVDTVNATSDFARLGYGIEEAEKLADASAIYKNVGDGIEDIGAASESIISTMQAFGIEATDAMSIVDKFNEVGKVVPNGIVICRKKTAISVKSQRWSRPRKDLMFYMIKHHLSVTTVMLYMATYRASLSPCYTG